MDRKEVERHLDAMLALTIVDKASEGDPEPMSTEEIAESVGMTEEKIKLIEFNALKKLKLHPSAWDAASMMFRQ